MHVLHVSEQNIVTIETTWTKSRYILANLIYSLSMHRTLRFMYSNNISHATGSIICIITSWVMWPFRHSLANYTFMYIYPCTCFSLLFAYLCLPNTAGWCYSNTEISVAEIPGLLERTCLIPSDKQLEHCKEGLRWMLNTCIQLLDIGWRYLQHDLMMKCHFK